MDIRNIKLTLAYDGTAFSGFQRQRNTTETIQEKLEIALRKLTGEETILYGAGRTDAGVHAAGQVVNFRTQSTIPADRWGLALRGLLPKDIVVYKSEEVSEEFHARYSAITKTYIYRIWRSTWPSVFNQRYSLHYPGDLDRNAIEAVLPIISGRHDFECFASKGTSVTQTVRTISELQLEILDDEWRVRVRADGFLYHMVRNIVGTLLWVGEKRITCEQVKQALDGVKGIQLGPTAPALGLCLHFVEY
jgi:tRNA pseudouridine38-40 synthase